MMSEFGINNSSGLWDLQGIVKGRSISCSSNNTSNSMKLPTSYDAWFDSLLEDLHHQNMEITSLTNLSQDVVDSSVDDHNKPSLKSTNISCESTRATISKRRKNKHKIINMVQQAGGDRILSDKWNWRKYGEKVIKGSPYPRSYYRCSYSGGCSARKQVEESHNEAGIVLYVITYMEEHTHPYPTRRHSQAGRSVKRFNKHSLSSTKLATTINNQSPNINTMITSSSSESSTKNNNDDQVSVLQGEDQDEGSNVGLCVGNYDNNNNQSVCFEDDFFAGLDYLERLSVNLYD